MSGVEFLLRVTNDRRSPVVFPASSRLTSSSPDAALIQAICHQFDYSLIRLTGVKRIGTHLAQPLHIIRLACIPPLIHHQLDAVEPGAGGKVKASLDAV
jgi:hypothetical protein